MTKKEILEAVAAEYDVTESEIMGRCRQQPLAEARQMAEYIFHKELYIPKSAIGRMFGKAQASIDHAVKRIEALMSVDRVVRLHHDRIMNALKK